MTHQCPRPECSRKVADDMFACRGDWYALPQDIRDAIWASAAVRRVWPDADDNAGGESA